MLLEKGKSFFFVFEGIDGSGKTTLSKLLLSILLDHGYEVVWYREPSDSEWGTRIRDLSRNKESIPPSEELNLFMLDREWDVKNNILPAMAENKIVILDRYYYSTACYQGARGLEGEEILRENKRRFPRPNLVYLIDCDVKTALARISENREFTAPLFEKEEFLTRVRNNYLRLQEDNLQVIESKSTVEATFDQVKMTLTFG
jgi:dTMP kinase